jgi:hypothetical protein
MPHAEHFLSRLDRVSSRETELALTLYNDHELVAAVLRAAKVPDEAHRVALPLADGEGPPHVVVTRAGHFVTCLGAGMRPAKLFVVPRATLEAVMTGVREIRTAVAAAKQVRREGRSPVDLLDRVFSAGPQVTREEMRSLLALTPLIGHELVGIRYRVAADLAESRIGLANLLSRVDKVKWRESDRFERFWLRTWATAHLAVLTASVARDAHVAMLEDGPQQSLTLDLTSTTIAGPALRGAWVNARLGRAALPQLKHSYASGDNFLDLADAALGLCAVGLRHTRTRAEVLKALAAGRVEAEDARPWAKYFAALGEQVFADVVGHEDASRRGGGGVQVGLAPRLPAGSAWRFERWEDVPLDLAVGHQLRAELEFVHTPKNVGLLFLALPGVVRQRPEDLYLPAAVVSVLRKREPFKAAIAMLNAWRLSVTEHRAEIAKQRPEGPPRQGPCPCGSGKKYKRCCEGKAASPA